MTHGRVGYGCRDAEQGSLDCAEAGVSMGRRAVRRSALATHSVMLSGSGENQVWDKGVSRR